MRTGLPKQKKTTDIWFDEKDPLDPYPYPQHRLEEAACLPIAEQLPGDVCQPDRRRPGNGLHGV